MVLMDCRTGRRPDWSRQGAVRFLLTLACLVGYQSPLESYLFFSRPLWRPLLATCSPCLELVPLWRAAPASNFASPKPLRPRRGSQMLICLAADEWILPSNSLQRKRECSPANKAVGDAHNAHDDRPETDLSVSTDE